MTTERTHEQEMAWLKQQHEQMLESKKSEAETQIALAEIEIKKLEAQGKIEYKSSEQQHLHQGEKRWSRSRIAVIFLLGSAGIGAILATLVFSIMWERVAVHLIEYTTLIVLLWTLSASALATLFLQGYLAARNQEQKDTD